MTHKQADVVCQRQSSSQRGQSVSRRQRHL